MTNEANSQPKRAARQYELKNHVACPVCGRAMRKVPGRKPWFPWHRCTGHHGTTMVHIPKHKWQPARLPRKNDSNND